MCGIVGFVDKKMQDQDSKASLAAMLNMLVHRGPDDSGELIVHTDHLTIGLGHRRLSVIDTSTGGHQPMFYKGKKIIFNGEVYNYQEITAELKEKGYTFSSHSDTEVILKAYDCWGMKCVEKFNGMWAFVIYDEDTRKMVLCRDRSGVKPLYWYSDGDRFLFGSELKAFSPYKGFRKEISKAGMALFFQFNYIREPHTIFRNVYKLEAGHYLEVSLGEKIEIRKQKYWDIQDWYARPKLKMDRAEAVNEIERLMIRGFNYRMVADVPVGIFLSAGIDSSLVAAILQATNKNKLKTFTIGFEQSDHDEAPRAKKIAAHIGTEHNELYCTDREFTEILHLLPDIIDEPFGDTSIIPTMLLSRFARQQVTVALSADGGDELFAGYPGFTKALDYYRKFRKIPAPFRKMMGSGVRTAASFLPAFSHKKNQGNKLVELLEARDSLDIYESMTKYHFDEDIAGIFGLTPETLHDPDYINLNGNTIDSLLSAVYKTFMNNEVLFKVDKATMTYSLEGREPFLDKDLVEFVAQLPVDLKIHNGILKSASKEILYRYVPESYFDHTKRGFSPPPRQLTRHVEERFDHALLQRLIADGLLPPSISKRLASPTLEWKTRWLLFIFLEWYKKWAA
jgi:asparagine synthase (glutamine-hydrolysing)